MAYMGDVSFWDGKFAARQDALMSPEKSLVDHIVSLNAGSVLDLACGDGRNALFLLEKGFQVTGIDFSSQALARLKRFAQQRCFVVNTMQVDIGRPGFLRQTGIFDNIVIVHYRLGREQFSDIAAHISAGGILFVCGFGGRHKCDERIRQEDLIQPEDFIGLSPSFELLTYQEVQDDRGFIVTYIFRKMSG